MKAASRVGRMCAWMPLVAAAMAQAQDADALNRAQRDAQNPLRMIIEASKLKPRAKSGEAEPAATKPPAEKPAARPAPAPAVAAAKVPATPAAPVTSAAATISTASGAQAISAAPAAAPAPASSDAPVAAASSVPAARAPVEAPVAAIPSARVPEDTTVSATPSAPAAPEPIAEAPAARASAPEPVATTTAEPATPAPAPAPATVVAAVTPTPTPVPAPAAPPPRATLQLVGYVEPELPERVRRRLRADGEVLLAFTVNADGTVADVEVRTTSDRALDPIAIDAVRQWRYQPIGAPQAHAVQLVFKRE